MKATLNIQAKFAMVVHLDDPDPLMPRERLQPLLIFLYFKQFRFLPMPWRYRYGLESLAAGI